jgi:hypothetical protein
MPSRRQRVLVCFNNDDYVRNYVRTGVLSKLSKDFELTIIANGSLELSEELRLLPGFAGFFSITPATENRFLLHSQLLMWRNRRKSKTFLYRWLRMAEWGDWQHEKSPAHRLTLTFRWAISLLTKFPVLRIPLLGNRVTFPVASRILRFRMDKERALDNLVLPGMFDLIIFPSNAYEAAATVLIRLARKHQIPSLALIDNWDNLASKTVFWERPDHIAVWGPQAAKQALSIHGFQPHEIHAIGTPRFDAYFLDRSPLPRPAAEKTRLLFVGSAMPFDEISALSRLEEGLFALGHSPSTAEIIYRPHPWQQKRKAPAAFNPGEFSFARLDPQMGHTQFRSSTNPSRNSGFQPDLDYYPHLLNSVDAVVGPLTTMLFEGALCLRPVLALSYNDGVHPTTSRRYFSHFEGLDRVPGFVFCDDVALLAERLDRVLSCNAIDEQESDKVTSFYLYRDGRSYVERLASLAHAVANSAP